VRRSPGSGLALLAVWAAAACGSRTAPPPEPGTVLGFAPDLRGRRVMLLPVQQNLGVPGDADAELAFGLQSRGTGVGWILPAEVEEVLGRSPGIQARTRGLPVGNFVAAEVERVGDPLYGELRRLASLVAADAVLLPVQAALAAPVPGGEPSVRLWTALIEVRTGRVLWFSVLEGEPFPRGDPRGLASAVDLLSRELLWYATG
jgi:hypothetical protein